MWVLKAQGAQRVDSVWGRPIRHRATKITGFNETASIAAADAGHNQKST